MRSRLSRETTECQFSANSTTSMRLFRGGAGKTPKSPAGSSVSKKRPDSADADMSTFKVSIPEGISPGQEFQVQAGGRIVRVRCPQNSKPGQTVQITVPKEPVSAPKLPNSPNVTKIQDEDGSSAYMVGIPDGVRGGQQFPVIIEGQELVVTCPPNARPGSKVRVVPPRQPEQAPASDSAARSGMARSGGEAPSSRDEATQLFEVTVPAGVQPGQPFALLAGGVRVVRGKRALVVCCNFSFCACLTHLSFFKYSLSIAPSTLGLDSAFVSNSP